MNGTRTANVNLTPYILKTIEKIVNLHEKNWVGWRDKLGINNGLL
jgi:hypothetical protein